MSESLQGFLAELSEQGDVQGGTSGFTLSSEKAREKLKKFALAHPENYFLLIVSALYALGAREFRLTVDADDLIVHGNCAVERARLERIWESVAGSEGGTQNAGLRLLGLAILTSVRFEKVDWTISSADPNGSYRLCQKVRGDELPDPTLEEVDSAEDGTTVSVKRKDFKRVASRFFSQLTSRVLAKTWEEERLLAERVFLGALDSFEFNSSQLDCRLQSNVGLAVLRVGSPPDFLSARYCYQAAGERDMVVLVGGHDQMPGEPKKISWLWHGLKMGEIRSGLAYDFCRAFVVADDLRCDLSLTSLADTWDRQKAVRLAREATRTALEHLACSYIAEQEGHLDCQDPEMEDYLLQVLADRIDIQRNRHRLGSFNDTLVACPFFTVSEPDGHRRRASLFEIWGWIEEARNPALFRNREDWTEVPPWGDRPTVIYGETRHSTALIKIFGVAVFHDAKKVALSLEKLSSGGRAFKAPEGCVVRGETEVDGQRLNWSVALDGQKGRLVVLKRGQVFFEDHSLELPDGFLFYGEADWVPNFGGRLENLALRERLAEHSLELLVEALHNDHGPPGEPCVTLSALVCKALGAESKHWQNGSLSSKDWLVVRSPEGPLRRLSPVSYHQALQRGGVPRYYLTLEEASQREGASSTLPLCLVVRSDVLPYLPQPIFHARGVELHAARPPFSFPAGGFEVIEIEARNLPRLPFWITRVTVGFPTDTRAGGQVTLEVNLRGHKLQTLTVSSFVAPATLCFEIDAGWPDSKGCHLVDKEQHESIKDFVGDVLTEAGRRLLDRIGVRQFAGLNPELQQTLTIDLWSEGEQDRQGRFFSSDQTRLSPAELHRKKTIPYFTDWNRRSELEPGTLFLTDVQAQALRMTAETHIWVDALLTKPASVAPTPPRKSEENRPPEKKPVKPGIESETPSPAPSESASAELDVEPQPQAPSRSVEPPPEHSASEEDKKPVETREEEPELPFDGREVAPGSTIEQLCGLLARLGAGREIPFQREFGLYITTVAEQEMLSRPLEDHQGKPIIRSLTKPDNDYLIALLSALYSFFNRAHENVEDHHEREFHLALVEHAVRR